MEDPEKGPESDVLQLSLLYHRSSKISFHVNALGITYFM